MATRVFRARRGRSHGAAVEMRGSARDGQLSPRVTRRVAGEGDAFGPVSSDYRKRVPVHEKSFAPRMLPSR
jgi:hypothetical protein